MTELTPAGTPVSIDLMMLVDGIRDKVKAGDVSEIAEGAGVTPPTLYEFIGKRRLPTIPTLQKLVDYFAIPVDAATHRVPTFQAEPQRVVIVGQDEVAAPATPVAIKKSKAV